jgi:hypothetical protein
VEVDDKRFTKLQTREEQLSGTALDQKRLLTAGAAEIVQMREQASLPALTGPRPRWRAD